MHFPTQCTVNERQQLADRFCLALCFIVSTVSQGLWKCFETIVR